MNVLLVGSGKGSWDMRGVQVGAALGARVTSQPSVNDWRWADVAILLKRQALTWAPFAHQYGVPIIWDVLDCWHQPRDNRSSVEEGIRFVNGLRAVIRPAALIAATQAMADDLGGVYIPHQCRPGLAPLAPQQDVCTVAYDGSERYLGRWRGYLDAECQRRHWVFSVNPTDLRFADILVALRDGEWDGPLCRRWKSGVKAVNALCAGRPLVTQLSEGWRDINTPAQFVDGWDSLPAALDACADHHFRATTVAIARTQAPAFSVSAIVDTYYRPLLASVGKEARCVA